MPSVMFMALVITSVIKSVYKLKLKIKINNNKINIDFFLKKIKIY